MDTLIDQDVLRTYRVVIQPESSGWCFPNRATTAINYFPFTFIVQFCTKGMSLSPRPNILINGFTDIK